MNESNSPHWEIKKAYPLHSGLKAAYFLRPNTKEESHGWITAQNEIYIGSFSTLPPFLQKSFIAPFSEFFKQLSETIFCYNTDFQTLTSAPPYQILHQVPHEICFELLLYWCKNTLKKTRFLETDYLLQFGYTHHNYNLLNVIKPLNIATLQEILCFRTHQKTLPTLLSPLPPGLIVKAQHHILLKNLICYRFQDPFQKEIFYLIWSHNLDPATTAPCFYAPSQSLIIGHNIQINIITAQILAWIICFPEPKNFNTTPSEIEMDDYGIGQISHFWEGVANQASSPIKSKNTPPSWDIKEISSLIATLPPNPPHHRQ